MKNKYFLFLAAMFIGTSLVAQNTVWNGPAAGGDYEVAENWTEGYPTAEGKAVFNVPEAGDCMVTTDTASCGQIVIGDNNNYGGVLTVQDGAVLTTKKDGAWSTIGYNASGEMVIEAGGTVNSIHRFHVGLVEPAEAQVVVLEVAGTLNAPKFTVNDPGNANWDASCYVTTGGWIETDVLWIGDGGMIDVTGGTIVVNGDAKEAADGWVTSGQLTSDDDGGPVVEWKITGEGAEADTATWITSASTVGVAPLKAREATLGVYPNPATNNVYFKENIVADVNIYNITGEVVLRATNVSQVNVESLKPGYYIVKAEADRKVYVDKLLIE